MCNYDVYFVLQHYIHGSSQGQFVAETYMVLLLSILYNKSKPTKKWTWVLIQ